jgi:hypothetical protein
MLTTVVDPSRLPLLLRRFRLAYIKAGCRQDWRVDEPLRQLPGETPEIASTNATPVSAMPTASAASVCNFIIDQTPGLIFLRSAYEAGVKHTRPRPAWSSARPLPICRQPAVSAPLAHYVPEARKG